MYTCLFECYSGSKIKWLAFFGNTHQNCFFFILTTNMRSENWWEFPKRVSVWSCRNYGIGGPTVPMVCMVLATIDGLCGPEHVPLFVYTTAQVLSMVFTVLNCLCPWYPWWRYPWHKRLALFTGRPDSYRWLPPPTVTDNYRAMVGLTGEQGKGWARVCPKGMKP